MQIVCTEIKAGVTRAGISAVMSGLDNARETIDDKGLITGIAPDDTFSARIDQGIAKLQASLLFTGMVRSIAGAADGQSHRMQPMPRATGSVLLLQ